jgi:hypothetical protein
VNVHDLLDLLLDGEYVGWQITRTDHGLEVVGILPNGEYRLLTVIPTEPSTIDQDTLHVG